MFACLTTDWIPHHMLARLTAQWTTWTYIYSNNFNVFIKKKNSHFSLLVSDKDSLYKRFKSTKNITTSLEPSHRTNVMWLFTVKVWGTVWGIVWIDSWRLKLKKHWKSLSIRSLYVSLSDFCIWDIGVPLLFTRMVLVSSYLRALLGNVTSQSMQWASIVHEIM